MLAPLVLLAREGVGVAQVLFEVEEDRVLLLVPFLERRPQPRRPAAHVDAGVLLPRVELAAAAPEELQQVLVAVAAEADGVAAEDLPAADVEAGGGDLG